MKEQTHDKTMKPARLPDTTRISDVQLRVSNLQRSESFYSDVLGLKVIAKDNSTVSLGAGNDPLVLLTEDSAAVQRPRRSTGLFHVAIRFPSRTELARAFKRLYQSRWPSQGFADHGVSEALYLPDPDGIGIELYADRPKEDWKYVDGNLQMGTWELDLESLVGLLDKDDNTTTGAHEKTDIGHVHLNISDLGSAERFYGNTLGFDVVQRDYPGALFVSAGGYHHHIGLNIWAGKGAPPAPKNAVGMMRFGIAVPDDAGFNGLLTRTNGSPVKTRKGRRSVILHDQDGIEIEVTGPSNN